MMEDSMFKRSNKFWLLALSAAIVLSLGLSNRTSARAQEGAFTWDKPQTVIRKAKPRYIRRVTPRAPKPKPVEQVPLLTLQWRVLKVGPDGTQNETNPGATFYPGDRLRVAVKVNQSGYLTIIHQGAPDKDGAVIFPDSRINNGQNYVNKNQEFVIPSACPAGINPRDCALVVAPPAGREYFTLVFSRDLISDLTAKVAAGGLNPQVLQQLKTESGQILKRGQGINTGPYAIWVVNTNTKDNEEIIETLVLNKGGQAAQ
jgi:hypothetical protein